MLIVSGIQTSILILFNTKHSLKSIKVLEEINLVLVKLKKEDQPTNDSLAIKLIEEELDLLVAEQILIKSSTNEYSVNKSFSSQNYKIVLNKKKTNE